MAPIKVETGIEGREKRNCGSAISQPDNSKLDGIATTPEFSLPSKKQDRLSERQSLPVSIPLQDCLFNPQAQNDFARMTSRA